MTPSLDVPKSLIVAACLALPTAFPLPALAAAPAHPAVVVSSGRSVSPGTREAWFRQHVEKILSGRATPQPRDTEH